MYMYMYIYAVTTIRNSIAYTRTIITDKGVCTMEVHMNMHMSMSAIPLFRGVAGTIKVGGGGKTTRETRAPVSFI